MGHAKEGATCSNKKYQGCVRGSYPAADGQPELLPLTAAGALAVKLAVEDHGAQGAVRFKVTT